MYRGRERRRGRGRERREREGEREREEGWGGTVSHVHVDKEGLGFSGVCLCSHQRLAWEEGGEGGRVIKAVIQCFEISRQQFRGSGASAPPSLSSSLAVG